MVDSESSIIPPNTDETPPEVTESVNEKSKDETDMSQSFRREVIDFSSQKSRPNSGFLPSMSNVPKEKDVKIPSSKISLLNACLNAMTQFTLGATATFIPDSPSEFDSSTDNSSSINSETDNESKAKNPIEVVTTFAAKSISHLASAIEKDTKKSSGDVRSTHHIDQSMNQIFYDAVDTVTNSGIIPVIMENISRSGESSTHEDMMTLDSFGLDEDFNSTEKADSVLSISYRDDLNILQLHRKVLRNLELEGGGHLNELKEQLSQKEDESRKPQTIIDRKITLREISELKGKISKIEKSELLDKYLDESQEFLYKYQDIGPKEKLVIFGEKQVTKSRSDNSETLLSDEEHINERRHQVIGEYLEIAGKYVDIDILRVIKFDNNCHICGHDLTNLTQIEDELTFCPQCNVEVKVPPKNKSSESENNDITRNVRQEGYDDRPNFVNAANRKLGRPKVSPPLDIYDKIDKYFIKNRLMYLLRENVRSQGHSFITDKRRIMYEALRNIEYPNQYANYDLIVHNYWGVPLPDFGYLMDKMMEDYDLSQTVYVQLKGNRKSSLNTQFRLFCHLRKLGWDCKVTDFKIISSKKSVKWHKDMWKKICTRLNWPNPDYLDEIKEAS